MTEAEVASVVARLRARGSELIYFAVDGAIGNLNAVAVADLLEREHRGRVEAEEARDGHALTIEGIRRHYQEQKARAETAERERDALRKRIEDAPKVTLDCESDGMRIVPEHTPEAYAAVGDLWDKTVALVPVGDGE